MSRQRPDKEARRNVSCVASAQIFHVVTNTWHISQSARPISKNTTHFGEEGGIAAQISETKQNQALPARPRRRCVPVLCPEVDRFFGKVHPDRSTEAIKMTPATSARGVFAVCPS